MTEPEIYSSLHEIFAEVFVLDDVKLNAATTAKDISGWDSFKQIEIIMAVEERLGVKFQTREIDNLQCVGDLVAVIARKT
jgi:acyl carrier protein